MQRIMNMCSRILVGLLATVVLTGCDLSSPNPSSPEPEETGKTATLNLTDVEARLRSLDLEAQRAGEVEQGFLAVRGTLLRVPGAELQVYVYPDSVARAQDTAPLDRTRVAPPTMMINWIMPATLVEVDNVAVILLTRDEGLRARIRRALLGRSAR